MKFLYFMSSHFSSLFNALEQLDNCNNLFINKYLVTTVSILLTLKPYPASVENVVCILYLLHIKVHFLLNFFIEATKFNEP